MITTVILHRVADYSNWRKVYDEFEPVQREGGVLTQSVHRSNDDPNNVLVLHSFADIARAEAFLANPALKAAMQRGGVEGPPRIEIFNEAATLVGTV